MKRISLVLCALLMACSGAGVALAEEELQPLHALAAPYGFRMGAPLSYGQLQDQAYLSLVTRHFNSVTATNEMKAYSLLDEQASRRSEDGMPVMNYFMADQMVGWAQAQGIGVRGHVLVWDAYMCDWYFHEEYDRAKPYADPETIQLRTAYYIDQVIRHFEEKFPGVVYCWDVVNEAVGDSAGEYAPEDPRHLRTLRSGGPNLFQQYMGEDYVALSFLYAKNTVEALGADIKLYYNDYNAFFSEKATAIRALAESVNHFATDENGEPRRLLDGIGMQGYIGGYGTQQGCLEDAYLTMIRDEILRYAEMGLEVQITEMAVRHFDLAAADKHAAYYARLFKVLMGLQTAEGNPLKAVSIWWLTDYPHLTRGNYVYDLNSPYGGLVDEHYAYKDAFRQVVAALSGE